MKAALLHTLGQPPRFADFPDPTPTEDEFVVQVRAASLKNIDKMLASGTHYGSHGELPVVCGVDGVGVLANGTRIYFGGSRSPYGTMAEKALAYKKWWLPIPDEVDDITAAALPNPALSAWLPLVWRAQLQPGETVLILGATGVAGKLAVQIAKHLGAGRVVAAGRNQQILATLPALGADALIRLDQPTAELSAAFAHEAQQHHFDIVLDLLWGRPAEALITAITRHDLSTVEARTRYVQIGEMAGPTIALPAAALRSSGLEMYGSGSGSASPQAIYEAFPQVMALAASGKLQIDTEEVPLAEVEQAWQRQETAGRRLVIIP